MKKRKILVTSALPYSNGQIHIGHLVEYIQTDIWVRFQRLRGHECRYFCAEDTHGAAITIAAEKMGVDPEQFVEDVSIAHQRDFAGFAIEFDNYGSTNTPETLRYCNEFWTAIRAAGIVEERQIEQLYDPVAQRFLADRYVRGTCPQCGKTDQYGDNCECGATYAATELINPISHYSGATPEVRSALHLFIEIERLHDFLDKWIEESDALQDEIVNFLKSQFLGDKLHAWDVSRPAPYFGFEIPDFPGNYWYVWFDAPIGYIGSTAQWCEKNGENIEDWWKNPEVEIHHFIGKDICYFHTLFWPAMLKIAGYTIPKKVHVHGFLTVNGKKMSKSRGTFVLARTYLNHLDPAYLRYFFASKTGYGVDDLDLNMHEMEAKINADLVGNIVNIASRTAKFANLTGLSKTYPEDNGLFKQAAAISETIAEAYEQRDYNKALRYILECGYRANKFIENSAPWTLHRTWAAMEKDPEADPNAKQEMFERLQDTVTIGLNLFRQIIVYLAPILPQFVENTNEFLGSSITKWSDAQTPLTGSSVNKYKTMMERVPRERIEAMIEETKKMNTPEKVPVVEENCNSTETQTEDSVCLSDDPWKDSGQMLIDEPMADTITIDDFLKVDLRVGRIVAAEHVEEARKLLKLVISLGGNHTRQVFAGIKAAYPEPEQLVGRLVILVANLQPRKMKFGLSEGMVVASGPGGPDVFLTFPDEGAKPGMRLH